MKRVGPGPPAGFLLVSLGMTVMTGWWLHVPQLVSPVPHAVPMVINTALCFAIAGAALLAFLAGDAWRGRLLTVAGMALVAITLAVLAEHLLQADLGVDWAALQSWAGDDDPKRGRMSVPTSIAFLSGGMVLLLSERVRQRGAGRVLRALTLVVGAVGVLAIIGYVLHAQLLFPDYVFFGVAVHTAAGLLLLSVGLWSACGRYAWARGARLAREEDRITVVGAMILSAIAVTAGIASFAILQDQTQTLVSQNLLASLTRRIETFRDFIALRETNARIAATRPAVLANLREIRAGRDLGSNLANIRAVATGFVQNGYGGVAYFDVAGNVIAQAGVFEQAPDMTVHLATPGNSDLLWRDGFLLRHRLPLEDGAGVAGSVLVEQSLPVLTRLMFETPRIGSSAEIGLCLPLEQQIRCFPTRLNTRPFVLPLQDLATGSLPIMFAFRGLTGVTVTRDYRGQNVIAAHGPVAGLGLGMVVKVDAAEAFAPIRDRLQIVMVVLGLVVAGGTLLLRSRIKPLVTQLLRSTADLREHREQFRTIVAGVRDYAIIRLDKSGHIASWNAGAEQIKGYREDEIVGQHFSRFYPREEIERGKPDAELRTVAAEGRFEEEGWRVRKDGSWFWASVVITALHDDAGQLRGFVKFTRDATERRRLEEELREKNSELERASLAKDRFLASMSHELRTPLNAIIGFTGTLLMKLPGPLLAEQEKQLRTVQTSGRYLLSLINDLLDLARIDADKMELDIEDVDCNEVVEEVAALLRPGAEMKSLTFDVELPQPPLVVRTDRRALRQILINLAGNAIKFTGDGGVRMRLERGTATAQTGLTLLVQDTGPGIRDADRPRLFQPFSRLETPDRRKLEGTGLGLHLSYRLAQQLGGDIAYSSEPGQGSTFTLVVAGA